MDISVVGCTVVTVQHSQLHCGSMLQVGMHHHQLLESLQLLPQLQCVHGVQLRHLLQEGLQSLQLLRVGMQHHQLIG